jgi:hypothetical protein
MFVAKHKYFLVRRVACLETRKHVVRTADGCVVTNIWKHSFSACSKVTQFLYFIHADCVGRDNSVADSDGPEIISRRGRDIPFPTRSTLDPTKPALHNGYRVSFPGEGVAFTTQPDKEKVELYPYPSEPSWPVIGLPWSLPLPYEKIFRVGRSLFQRCPTKYVSLSLIRYNSNHLHLQWVDIRGQTEDELIDRFTIGFVTLRPQCT